MEGRKAGGWHPAPRDLSRQAVATPWTRERPAPDVVGWLHVFDMLSDFGRPPSRRELAAAMGWTGWKAGRIKRRAEADFEAWSSGAPLRTDHRPTTNRPPDPAPERVHDDNPTTDRPPAALPGLEEAPDLAASTFRPRTDHRPTTNRPPDPAPERVPDDNPTTGRPPADHEPTIARAHLYKDKDKKTANTGPVDPSDRSRAGRPSSPPVPVKSTFDRMNELRRSWVAGARSLDLTAARRRALSARIRAHSVEDVLLVWEWLHTAIGAKAGRAPFLREGAYGVDTVLRASKFAGYLDMARDWADAGRQASTSQSGRPSSSGGLSWDSLD